MIIQQIIKTIILIIASIAMLILPLLMQIYYLPFYYLIAVILIPLSFYRLIRHEHFEQKFARRWKKTREKGYWRNVLIQGVRSIVLILIISSLTPLFAYGMTPIALYRQSFNEVNVPFLIFFMIFILIFYVVTGILQYYENEKRYNRVKE